MDELELQARKEKLGSLQKKFKRKKYMALLLALFTLGVNAFAWFVFSFHADYTYEGKVSSWDVEVKEDDHLVNNFIISVNMQPGMTDFEKEYEINNQGEVDASVDYEITSLSILGRSINLQNVGNPVTYLETFYPFSISVQKDKATVAPNDTGHFTITVSWDFEDATAYYRLNEIYDYNSTFKYYKLSGSDYNEYTVTSSNYLSNRNTLYLFKDDADTYFGMACGNYQRDTGLNCLEATIALSVEQAA